MQPGSTAAINESVYQGRFKAILVENESYAWELSRYIHLNPVRAKIVQRPEEHRFSSYRHFLRSRGVPDWLDWQTVRDEMEKDRSRTRQAYRRYVGKGMTQDVESPLRGVVGRLLLGSADWVETMRVKLGLEDADSNVPEQAWLAWQPSTEHIEIAVAAEFGVEVETLLAKRVRNNEARSAALYLIRRLTSVSATRLAERYGPVSQAAISKAVQRAELKRDEQPAWRRRMIRLESKLRKRN